MGNIFGKFINVAQESKSSSFADEFDGKSIKPDTKDIKQFLDFCLIAFPVFGRKSPKGNVGDFEFDTVLNKRFDGVLGGLLVTFDGREASLFGPTAITIHDDRDVLKGWCNHGFTYLKGR